MHYGIKMSYNRWILRLLKMACDHDKIYQNKINEKSLKDSINKKSDIVSIC